PRPFLFPAMRSGSFPQRSARIRPNAPGMDRPGPPMNHGRREEPPMAATQAEKAETFRALHERGCFVIPNPWDAGSAVLLSGMGFQALATTSAGVAFQLARLDGANVVSREETLEIARLIVEATDLPVAADLEDGFGPRPEDA